MRKPLFGSVDSEPSPPELRWRVGKPPDIVGRVFALAGKPISLYTHRVGKRTLPCLRSLPALGMECPNCERARALKCYCPIVNLDVNEVDQPLRVLCGATTLRDSLRFIQVAKVLNIGRALTLKPTWYVSEQKGSDLEVVALSRCANLVPERGDITRWLLHYWQWPMVTLAFGEKFRESIRTKTVREHAEAHKMLLLTSEDLSA